jgi:triacylglycerol lipase
MKRTLLFSFAISVLAMQVAGPGQAQTPANQVPTDIETQLQKMGHIVDPACTAKLYRPLMPANDITSGANPLYPGMTVVRDASFGPNAKDVVDIFSGDKGAAKRTVLIYVPGGGGNKIELQDKEANAFYDNIGRWAVKNGMVYVQMQRHPGPEWNSGAKDVSAMLQWVEANIAKYHGNPERMFIWAQSAGNGPVGIYLGHPELYGPKGAGVKGAILMSGQFDILPVEPGGSGPSPADFGNAGKLCGAEGPGGDAGALPGKTAGQPGGPNPAMTAGGPGGLGRPPQIDPQTALARSSLPGLKAGRFKLMLASAELDPGVKDGMSGFNQSLHDALCQDNSDRCPALLFEKGESHMSEVFAIGTPDTTVSGPILAWIKSVK